MPAECEKNERESSPSVKMPEALADMFDLSQKKKKKKRPIGSSAVSTTFEQSVQPSTYTYQQLLTRMVNALQENDPSYSERKRQIIQPPQLSRVGKKTIWMNFHDSCKALNRSPEHVIQFFMAEYSSEWSVDGSLRLIMKGRFNSQQIEWFLRAYTREYVMCRMCRRLRTSIVRDEATRLHFMHCQECGSSRSVAPIKAGTRLTTREDRRVMRNSTHK